MLHCLQFDILYSKDRNKNSCCRFWIFLSRIIGTYHHLFWNCQHFANCLLDIICCGKYRKYYVPPAILRRVMFLNITSAPTPTTRATKEEEKPKKLVNATTRVEELLAEEEDLLHQLSTLNLDQQSDAIIDALVPIPRHQTDNNNDNNDMWSCLIQ